MDWGEGREQKMLLNLAAMFHIPFVFTDKDCQERGVTVLPVVWG